jgi:hypothetical protein
MMKDVKQKINEACHAQAHLYVFAAVVGALENGTIHGGGTAEKTAEKIIQLCKAEMQRQVKTLDKAIEAAHGITKAGATKPSIQHLPSDDTEGGAL